jgi:hypothetical protein
VANRPNKIFRTRVKIELSEKREGGMNGNRRVVYFVSWLVLVGVFLVAGCKRTVTVNSRWSEDTIVVDGKDDEWRSGGMYYDASTNTKIGIRNDAQHLYLCLIIIEENIQRTRLEGGFTLWVSRDKRKNRLWGLRYPVGGEASGEMAGPGGRGGGGPGEPANGPRGYMGGGDDTGGPEGDPQAGGHHDQTGGGPAGEGRGQPGGETGRVLATVTEYELLTSIDEPGRSMGSEALGRYGIEGRFSLRQGGGLVYEAKIPITITERTPYAAVASKKGACLIGLVSEEAGFQGSGDGMGDDMGRGGMGEMGFSDMGGGGMNGRERGRGGMGGDMGRGGMGGSTGVSALELWADIQLATEPKS